MSSHQIDPRDILTARALRVAIDPAHPEQEILLEAATIIRHGGIVAHPTETFYGLAVNPFSAKAVARLEAAKGRVAPQALILLLAHTGQAGDVARLDGIVGRWYDKLTRAFWPGPLTLVLPLKPRLACPALAGGVTVAVRLSSHPVAWQLARTCGAPITSTSANPTGQPPAAGAAEIDPALAVRLDLILDGGPVPGGRPSTILDLSGSRPAILRDGAVPPEKIAAVLGIRPRTGMVAA